MAVYLEDPRRATIAPVATRHFLLKFTGFAFLRITVVLAVQANRFFWKIYFKKIVYLLELVLIKICLSVKTNV